MSYIIKIKNDSGSTKTWCGKEFTDQEEYIIPTDSNRGKWINNSTFITAIGNSEALVGDGSSYFSDVNQAINWLKGQFPTDSDGAPLTRVKLTKTGWHYQCNAVEWETSKLSSIYNKDKADSDLGYTTIKFYNSSNTELTTQGDLDTSCVKTVITFEMDQDIEIIGGILFQATAPTSDVRIWVTAIPDLPVANGGSVPFCQGGINLKHMGTGQIYSVDGRTPKHMPYNATYHTNKFEITCLHPAGTKHQMMMVFQLFRENV